jgi:hypothetical protein
MQLISINIKILFYEIKIKFQIKFKIKMYKNIFYKIIIWDFLPIKLSLSKLFLIKFL